MTAQTKINFNTNTIDTNLQQTKTKQKTVNLTSELYAQKTQL